MSDQNTYTPFGATTSQGATNVRVGHTDHYTDLFNEVCHMRDKLDRLYDLLGIPTESDDQAPLKRAQDQLNRMTPAMREKIQALRQKYVDDCMALYERFKASLEHAGLSKNQQWAVCFIGCNSIFLAERIATIRQPTDGQLRSQSIIQSPPDGSLARLLQQQGPTTQHFLHPAPARVQVPISEQDRPYRQSDGHYFHNPREYRPTHSREEATVVNPPHQHMRDMHGNYLNRSLNGFDHRYQSKPWELPDQDDLPTFNGEWRELPLWLEQMDYYMPAEAPALFVNDMLLRRVQLLFTDKAKGWWAAKGDRAHLLESWPVLRQRMKDRFIPDKDTLHSLAEDRVWEPSNGKDSLEKYIDDKAFLLRTHREDISVTELVYCIRAGLPPIMRVYLFEPDYEDLPSRDAAVMKFTKCARKARRKWQLLVQADVQADEDSESLVPPTDTQLMQNFFGGRKFT
ncbi:unnamed protein product [Sympodiomycopsis kandeliae]